MSMQVIELNISVIQRFSEVTDQLGTAILSVIPRNPLLWAFLMENLNLGRSVIPENPLFPNPLLSKTSAFLIILKAALFLPVVILLGGRFSLLSPMVLAKLPNKAT